MAIPWAMIAEGVAKAYQEREKAKNDQGGTKYQKSNLNK